MHIEPGKVEEPRCWCQGGCGLTGCRCTVHWVTVYLGNSVLGRVKESCCCCQGKCRSKFDCSVTFLSYFLLLILQTVIFTNQHGESQAAKDRAIMEAGVCCAVVHPNVVATYHYDIRAIEMDEGATGLKVDQQATDWKLYLVQVSEICFVTATGVFIIIMNMCGEFCMLSIGIQTGIQIHTCLSCRSCASPP
jgi:hypothetical protein